MAQFDATMRDVYETYVREQIEASLQHGADIAAFLRRHETVTPTYDYFLKFR